MHQLQLPAVATAVLVLAVSACSDPTSAVGLEPQYGTAYEDRAAWVATNEAGQLYTLGSTSEFFTSPGEDTLKGVSVLRRFSNVGAVLWSRSLGALCNTCYPLEYSLATDTSGNSYVLHGSNIEGVVENATLKKFGGDGTLLWSRAIFRDNLETGTTVATTSASGETSIAYHFRDFGPSSSAAHLVKYRADGQKVFAKTHTVAYPRDGAAAADGSFYLAGIGELAKYSAAGTLLWQRELPVVIKSSGEQLALSGSAVYVARGYTASTGKRQLALYRYSSAGSLLWGRTLSPRGEAAVTGLSADGAGNPHLVGWTDSGRSGERNYFVRKYTAAGDVLWSYVADMPGSYEEARDVSAADSGKVYLVGTTDGNFSSQNLGGLDAFLLRLDSAGNKVWSR